ncbi:MAG: hypothetical protein ABIR70_03630 [Bryobacteraceae bacterium]
MARIVIAAYLLALFSFNVYRAATQSFTTDEIYSYKLYVGAVPFNLFHQYDANLHFLHTLATWGIVKLLGFSEFVFRLPSLAGCVLYFGAVYKLARRTTPLAALLLTAHPLLEDHMSVGRGYGLALGFFAWAFVEAVAEVPRLTSIAVLLALSIGTNLTFLFPASALIAALILQRRDPLLLRLTGPWIGLTALLLAIPLSNMQPGALYFGAARIPDSLRSLVEYPESHAILPFKVVAAVTATILLGCACTAFWKHRFAANQYSFVSTATLSLTVLAVLASHYGFGMPYPYARTGLYFLFLVPLCLAPLAARRTPAIVLATAAIYVASYIRPNIYGEWAFDAAVPGILQTIEQQHTSGAPVRIAASAPMDTVLGHYRTERGMDWITAIEPAQWQPGFDYYVLRAGDFNQIPLLGLKEISWDVQAGVKVAVP